MTLQTKRDGGEELRQHGGYWHPRLYSRLHAATGGQAQEGRRHLLGRLGQALAQGQDHAAAGRKDGAQEMRLLGPVTSVTRLRFLLHQPVIDLSTR